MDHGLTTDQFRILRTARDAGLVPSSLLRPKGYLLDVEILLRGRFLTSRPGGFDLTPLGAACLGIAPAAAALTTQHD